LIQGRGTSNARKQEKQEDRNAKVVRIQIFRATLRFNSIRAFHLSGVAYDGNDAPVSGVSIKWSANDEGGKGAGDLASRRIFEP